VEVVFVNKNLEKNPFFQKFKGPTGAEKWKAYQTAFSAPIATAAVNKIGGK
jgi:hypothetical protein